jgi:alkylhydroperoxidase family enzyme
VQALAKADLAAAPVTDKERALLEFVRLITEKAHTARREDTDKLRQAGWTDDQIAEAVYIIAMFAFFNRVADAFGIEPMGYLAAGRVTP